MTKQKLRNTLEELRDDADVCTQILYYVIGEIDELWTANPTSSNIGVDKAGSRIFTLLWHVKEKTQQLREDLNSAFETCTI